MTFGEASKFGASAARALGAIAAGPISRPKMSNSPAPQRLDCANYANQSVNHILLSTYKQQITLGTCQIFVS